MPAAVKMTIDERRKYLTIIRLRYVRSTKEERGHLLDEMEAVTILDRKTLIRLLKGDLARHPRPSQRGRTYGPEVDDALRIISDSYDYICAERLTPCLPQMVRQLARHSELTLSPGLEEQLGAISIPTVRRILQRITQDQPRLARPASSQVNALLREIPMTTIPWDIAEPGHFETDLVHHSGPSTTGQYMHTLQLVDVKTGWSERVALLGRSYQRMEDAFGRVSQRLPFPIRELHPDNGGEFFNGYLLAYWAKEVAGAHLSRSRPFHKNDNRFVEQKNSSEVRAYFGTQRLDTTAQTVASNRLYDKLWVYYNLFQPVMHMDKKTFLPTEQGPVTVKRHYDDAKPPFDRLCATKTLTTAKQEELERLRDQTNPRRLKQDIYDLLDYILALPCADSCTS
jgi:hypothetical protein